jgi:KTSC domain
MSGVALHSSWLAAAHYQDQASVLELEFCDGAVYMYFQVPRQIFAELLQAESPGRYFNAQIRKCFASAKRRPASSGMRAHGGVKTDSRRMGVAVEC